MLPAVVAAGGAELSISIRDGDPHDRIFVSNTGACTLARGVLGIDFTMSSGGVLIDTQYGGAGTKDPMPVEVEYGPLHVHAVADGDRQIVIEVDVLLPGQSGTVTLDVDNEASPWFAQRVSILADHLEGSTARFAAAGHDATAVFDASGSVVVPLPDDTCMIVEPPVTSVPIS